MIGIVGYGMVGRAVEHGFDKCSHIISDPAYGYTDLNDVVQANPEAIFVCVPTPTDNTDYSILRGVLNDIKQLNYQGIVVVKSTALPRVLEDYDIVYNPEFLSRATACSDFINPPFVLLGGSDEKTKKVAEIYSKYSQVNLKKIIYTDVKTAALTKYMTNSFYSTKITFMNQMYDVAKKENVNWENLTDILKQNPWIGPNHLQVPGHEGRGFSGPCLPKDTEAMVKEYNVELLKKVLDINANYR